MNGHGDGPPIVDDAIPLGDRDALPVAGQSIAPADDLLTLSLDDLIPDARGEVVILSDAGPDIAVVTSEPIAGQGVETAHVTASGLDVSGFSYCTFAGGITLFYPASHRLLVTDDC
jgi:hypothetical protein